jgi:hypothetical protein
MDDGLSVLQGYYDGLFSNGAFSALRQVYKAENYVAGLNERIIADGATITIPDLIDGMPPADLDVIVVITDAAQKNYVFSQGRWETADNLELDSVPPLAARNKEGLSCALAVEISETYGGGVGPRTSEKATRFNSSLMKLANQTFEPGLTRGWLARDYYNA